LHPLIRNYSGEQVNDPAPAVGKGATNAIVSFFSLGLNDFEYFQYSEELAGSPAREIRRDSGGRGRDDFKGTTIPD
jgi:hypothetical protein